MLKILHLYLAYSANTTPKLCYKLDNFHQWVFQGTWKWTLVLQEYHELRLQQIVCLDFILNQ